MYRKALKRINGQHVFMLLLLVSALLQPAHTTNHSLQTVSFHVSGPVLSISDASSFESFSEHRENHDNELCGQCQFGFMGDGVQSSFQFSDSYDNDEFALSHIVLHPQSGQSLTRNRGPPIS